MEQSDSPRKSSCGLATDLIFGRRGMIPPVIFIPLTKALFTQDFAFHSRGRPAGLKSNEQLAHHFLFPTLPSLLRTNMLNLSSSPYLQRDQDNLSPEGEAGTRTGVPGSYFDFSEHPNQVYCLHYLEAGPLHPK